MKLSLSVRYPVRENKYGAEIELYILLKFNVKILFNKILMIIIITYIKYNRFNLKINLVTLEIF